MTRFLRHLIAPFVAYLVAAGLLPVWAQHDATELLVMVAAFVVAYVWSWWRDRKGQGVKSA